ncbi:MAG: GNAT family N-acetyltransferase [Pseudomonadota bacterium]
MKLREARPGDLPVLLEFEQGVIDEERPFNPAIRDAGVTYYDLPKLMSDPDSNLQVIEVDGRIVACGYVTIRTSKATFQHEKHAYLGFMYVDREFRGQGVNQQIVDALIEWGKRRDINDFYLDVYSGNQAAVRAYEKAGFQPLVTEMVLRLEH